MSRMRLVPVVAMPPACEITFLINHMLIVVPVPKLAYLFGQVSHGECLVKQPELPLLAFLVIRISEDATVQQSPMNIRDHTPDISRRVRSFPGRWIFDAIEIVYGGAVEMKRISLIERVNLATRRNLNIGMSEHEFSERGIECVTVDTITRREDEVRRRAIPSRERSDAVHPTNMYPTLYNRQQPFRYQASRRLQLCHANPVSTM